MELDGESKKAVKKLGDAINAEIEKSVRVMQAIEEIRASGFEPNIGIKLEIGLMPLSQFLDEEENAPEPETELESELTDEDLRELRKMNISLD